MRFENYDFMKLDFFENAEITSETTTKNEFYYFWQINDCNLGLLIFQKNQDFPI